MQGADLRGNIKVIEESTLGVCDNAILMDKNTALSIALFVLRKGSHSNAHFDVVSIFRKTCVAQLMMIGKGRLIL